MMKLSFYLVFLLVSGASLMGEESIRDWRTIGGGTFKAKLTGVHSTKVVLQNAKGDTVEFPIADLMPSDQKYIGEWQLANIPDSATVSKTAFANKALKDLVHMQEGSLRSYDADASGAPRYFVFYKSALWCPPCRSFTPKLVRFYEKQKAKGAPFELIFISHDRDSSAMSEYMEKYKMPWPAFRYNRNREIVESNGGGIPNLIVTDADGQKLLDSYDSTGKYIGPYAVIEELEKLLKNF